MSKPIVVPVADQKRTGFDYASGPLLLLKLITVLSETNDKVRGFSVGAVDYVTKPFVAHEWNAWHDGAAAENSSPYGETVWLC